MALIAMAIYSTKENGKDEYLRRTLKSLQSTVDFSRHRIIFSVNAFTEYTEHILFTSGIPFRVAFNKSNVGTAQAINFAWEDKRPGENLIKMDDDVVINSSGWVDRMEETIQRDPSIGQVGLKRRDCMESPDTKGFYQSTLRMLPHSSGEKWIVVEEVNHVMGTCVMHSAALINKIGYLYQPGVYGFDDSFMSLRSRLAGFKNVFLPYIDIEHIDPGTTPYQKWKENRANDVWPFYQNICREYTSGKRPLYYNPFSNDL